MSESEDDVLARISRTRTLATRVAACNALHGRLEAWPTPSLQKVFMATQDLMDKSAPPEARTAGFKVLSALLECSNLEDDQRELYLAVALQPATIESLEHQIALLSQAIQKNQITWQKADQLAEYLIACIEPQFEAQNAARKRARSANHNSSTRVSLPEERGMHMLLDFIADLVVRFPSLFTKERVTILMVRVLSVAEKASASNTVERVCLIIKAIIAVLRVPTEVLRRCVEDLCAIYNTGPRFKDIIWECLTLLLKSEYQNENEIVNIVLETIGLPPQERQPHTVCGAIRTARYLITRQGEPHIPVLDFARFMQALNRVNFGSRRIRRECLRTIGILLSDEKITKCIVDEAGWSPLFRVIYRAADSKQSGRTSSLSLDSAGIDEHETHSFEASQRFSGNAEHEEIVVEQVRHIADAFLALWSHVGRHQHELMVGFLRDFQALLTEDYMVLFVLKLAEMQYFGKTTRYWQAHQRELVDIFIINRNVDPGLRCTVIDILMANNTELNTTSDRDHAHSLLMALLHDFQSRKDLQVANALANMLLIQSNALEAPLKHLEQAIALIWPLLSVPDDPVLPDDAAQLTDFAQGTINTVSVSLVELFIGTVNKKAATAVLLFNTLVSVAQAQHLPSSARLPAVRLLTRIRCDLHHQVLVIDNPDVQGLAAALCRTEIVAPGKRLNIPSSTAADERIEARSSRASGISSQTQSTLRNNPRSSIRVEKAKRPRPPLWLYSGGPALPIRAPTEPSHMVRLQTSDSDKASTIHAGDWLVTAISVLQQPATDWEIYSYVLVHLPAQISNREAFTNSMPHIGMLRRILVDQLLEGNVYDPPQDTGVRRGDVALCLYHTLTMLMGYSEIFERKEQERLVQAFFHGVSEWERTAQFCIQALTICCYVLPAALTSRLSAILQKLSQVITQAHLSVDILEFLAGLARHRNLYINFREEEFRMVFAICVRYLEHSREQRLRLLSAGNRATTVMTPTGVSTTAGDHGAKPELYKDIPQYIFALAYHVITSWFLSVKISNRNDHVGWITKNLAWKDPMGNEIMEEQSQVTLDMMLRVSYLDLGETAPGEPFTEADGPILTKTWLMGISIVTIETAAFTGFSRVTKRQASGTTYAVYKHQTTELPPHHEPLQENGQGSDMGINIFPNHVLLQLTSSIAPTPAPMEAICLPDEDAVRRAIATFDRIDTVDGYKVGVVYVGNNQTDEIDILSNITGSAAFQTFLEGLGTKVRLQNATFNTQGLDKDSNLDGAFTYAWRDRVTEIIFHVPTMMPTDLNIDPRCVSKKKHIGNDYVNIIWNESGLPFKFDTFASQFNCVNIVIVPDAVLVPQTYTARQQSDEALSLGKDPYYTIQLFTGTNFPDLSPVSSYKLLPLKTLPLLARQLALQASVFSNVWMSRETGEHASSWRSRLREIKRLRERFANTGTSTSAKYPGAKSRTSYTTGDIFRGRVIMGGLAEQDEDLVVSLDFSRWAGPNAPLTG